MATKKEQASVITKGMDLDQVKDGAFIRNFHKRDDEWKVREGLGLLYRGDSTLSNNKQLQGGTTTLPNTTGYQEHLGSCIIDTAFGHKQIITVLRSDVFTGESDNVGTYSKVYSVNIFDIEDDTRAEYILHKYTADGGRAYYEQSVLKACYETSIDRDASTWIRVGSSPVSFQELAGNVYFASEGLGVWVYRPALVVERKKQLHGADKYAWSQPYGESSVVSPVTFADGLNTEQFDYITDSDVSSVSAICNHQGNLVYASGNTLFYSDPFLPNNIKARNSDIIPVLSDITAVASNGQLIYVFSKTETWVIQTALTNEGLISGGILSQISSEVGCASPQAITNVRNNPVWIGENGVYAIDGKLGLKEVSTSIRDYWRGGISDPYTHYATASGLTDLTNTQPTTFSRDTDKPFISYNEKYSELFCSFGNVTWVLNDGWYLWDYQTAYDDGTVPTVKDTGFILETSIVSLYGNTYVVGLNVPQGYSDGSQTTYARAYSIHQLGRGGGTDNSSALEDKSIVDGSMKRVYNRSSTDVAFYFALEEVNEAGEYVYLVKGIPPTDPAATAPTKWQVELGFDNTKWEPVVTTPGGVLLDYKLPHERIDSASGLTQFHRIDHATGVPSGTGDAIMIEYDNASYAQSWNLKQKNPLIYVKFIPKSTNLGSNTMGFTADATYVMKVDDGSGVFTNGSLWAWEQSYRPDLPNNSVGQPVEYVYKGATVDSGKGLQLRTRGLYSSITSHGKANLAASTYPYGLYNAAFGSDKRLYDAQVIDNSIDLAEVASKTSIRTRTQDSAGNMTAKTFGNTYYGDPADSTVGNLLVDDEQIDNIAISTSTKGESISTMVFGFIRDKAEVIKIHSIKMIYKVTGATRRRGR